MPMVGCSCPGRVCVPGANYLLERGRDTWEGVACSG